MKELGSFDIKKYSTHLKISDNDYRSVNLNFQNLFLFSLKFKNINS